MKFEIKSRWSGGVLFSIETETLKLALEAAVKSGADLRYADLSYADLRDADLSGADLRGADLRGADLRYADLSYADLRDADLSGADLRGADLSGADLRDADLSDADLSGAKGLPTAPIIPNIDARILQAIENGGKLNMHDWHTCETTHCRAGWACVLAGYSGGILEAKTSPLLAGKLIYEASRPGMPCPDFFATNEDALKDLKACAAADPIKE